MPARCFNGAAVVRLRKLKFAWSFSLTDLGSSSASMGPQSSDCGNHRASHGTRCADMTKLQWGRSRQTAETLRPASQRQPRAAYECFNGAAVVRLRKRGFRACGLDRNRQQASMGPQSVRLRKPKSRIRRACRTVAARLQWGRSRQTAETRPGAVEHVLKARMPASMGPQSSDCGNVNRAKFPADRRSWQSFNGAAVVRLRKRGSGQAVW